LATTEKVLERNRIHANQTPIKVKGEVQTGHIRNRFPARAFPKEIHPISAATSRAEKDVRKGAAIRLESRTKRHTRVKVANLILRERNPPAICVRAARD
jgi:hypothetical protein